MLRGFEGTDEVTFKKKTFFLLWDVQEGKIGNCLQSA